MKILMLTQFYAPVVGGEERAVEDLATALAAGGHEVAVATLRLDGTFAREELGGVRIHRLNSSFGRLTPAFEDAQRRHLPPLPDPEVVAGLRKVLAVERPDVVHAHNWIVHSAPAAIGRDGPPLVLSLHDYSLVCATKRLMRFGAPCSGPAPVKCVRCSAGHYGAAKGMLVAASLLVTGPAVRRRLDMCLPVSTAVAERLALADRGLPFEILPNIAPDRPDDDPRHVDRELLSMLPEDDFALFLGDATEDKGIRTLLEAYEQDGRLPLVLVGRPFGLPPQPAPNVHVLGAWPHASALEAVRRCSVLVAPSLVHETFGMATLEAMAAGRPVIASAVGGLAELVVDGETGLLVPPGDAAALRAAIAELAGDPSRRAALGEAGKARAARYSAERIVPRLEEVYGALLETRRARPTVADDVHD